MKTSAITRTLIALALGTVALTGCGDPTPESIAFVDDAPELAAPDLDSFSDDERLLIDFHAEWLCELERRTFTSLDGTDELLTEVLRDAGIDPATHDRFVRETLARQDVRDAVLYELLEHCRA